MNRNEGIKPNVPQVPENSRSGLSYDFLNEFTVACFANRDSATAEQFAADVKKERDGRIRRYEERFPADRYSNAVTEQSRPFIEEVDSLVDQLNEIVEHPEGHTFWEIRRISARIEKIIELPRQVPDEQRMGLEEAQETANMMRVKLGEIVGHEPTPKDYDDALAVVEEMKMAAQNETDGEKVFTAFLRIYNKFYSKGIDAFLEFVTRGKYRANEEWTKDRLKMFADARSELQRLKEEARKFENL